MRKKIFAVIILLLSASAVFASGMNAKFGVELRGGYAMVNPTSLNTAMSNVFTDGFSSVFAGMTTDVTGSKINGLALGSGSFQYFLMPNFALSLKTDFLYAENDDIISISGADIIDSHVALNIGYLGLGGRYYIGIDGVKGFLPYIGVDVGMFFQYGSFWEVWTEPSPSQGVNSYFPVTYDNQYSLLDFKDSFFGANIEGGVQYMFTDNVGISVGLGYKIASFPVNVAAATRPGVFNALTVTAIDLSGLYFSAGMNFAFGGSAASSKGGAAASSGTGAGAKYEQYGDYYFKAKEYTKANQYYGGALKADKTNTVLYKKIGACYYYMNDLVKAKQYLAYYLKLNPNDAEAKSMLGK